MGIDCRFRPVARAVSTSILFCSSFWLTAAHTFDTEADDNNVRSGL